MQRDKAAGFTLIEALVAMAIVALLLLPLLRSFSTGMASTARADAVDEATLVAQSAIERVSSGVDLEATADFERQEGRYHIVGHIRPYGDEGLSGGPAPPLMPYDVAVTVSWQDGAQIRSVALDALRLGASPAEAATP
jgi:type II secretion system protein I